MQIAERYDAPRNSVDLRLSSTRVESVITDRPARRTKGAAAFGSASEKEGTARFEHEEHHQRYRGGRRMCMTVTGLAACGSSSASGEKKLDFITGMATGSVHLKTLQSITDAFEKENPGVKINLIPSSQDFTQDIKVRLAARNAPDLWNTHGWSRDRYADFLEPLQNRSWAGKMKDLTKEAFMEDDGTFYALPLDIQVTGVLYNKDVLDKVGVDPNSLNTWDEFNDACAKVKEAGLTCVVAGGKDTAIAGDLADLTASAWYDDAELKNLQSGKFDSSVYEKESGLIEGGNCPASKGLCGFVGAAVRSAQKTLRCDGALNVRGMALCHPPVFSTSGQSVPRSRKPKASLLSHFYGVIMVL